jgi:hypothetical protein
MSEVQIMLNHTVLGQLELASISSPAQNPTVWSHLQRASLSLVFVMNQVCEQYPKQ